MVVIIFYVRKISRYIYSIQSTCAAEYCIYSGKLCSEYCIYIARNFPKLQIFRRMARELGPQKKCSQL